MKQPLFTLLFVTFLALACNLEAEEFEFNEKGPRSPEGQHKLEQLHANIIRSFKSERIQSRYLAARKLVQLNNDEINSNLINATIESMQCDNPNYKWFVAHYLQRISGKKHGIKLQAWREWLRKKYKEEKREVGKGPVSMKKKIKAKELKSEIEIIKNGGSVKAVDVPEGDKISETITTPIVKSKNKIKASSPDNKEVLGETMPKEVKKTNAVEVKPTEISIKTPSKDSNASKDEGSGKNQNNNKDEGSTKKTSNDVPHPQSN